MENLKTIILPADRPSAISERALPDWKELSATAFQRTRMPLVVTDATRTDCPIILANQAFLTLTGYGADEVLGRNCRFLQGPETSKAVIAQIRGAVDGAREVDVDILNYRKDGSPFWNRLHISPIHDDDGRLVYHLASQIDRTEIRRVEGLEASEHRLLLEVNHRANNVLALVDSIVRLSRSDDADEYAASVQRRVQALARAHSLLSRRGWYDIPLRDVIEGQIEPYDLRRVSLEGPEVLLAPHAVQPFALFIHELAVNASTHGALSQASGRVDVVWTLAPQPGGFSLAWQEFGGPAPSRIQRRGFGTVVAEATVERQLMGTLQRDWSDTGLKIVADVPNVISQVGFG